MKAFAAVLYRDHLLLGEAYDETRRLRYCRPLGGHLEFGEAAGEAAIRELREEIGRGIEVIAPLGIVEVRFVHEGVPGHEIVFEFVARFLPGEAPATLDPINAAELGQEGWTARWYPLAEVLGGSHTVFPEGLPERLASWINTL